MPESIIGNRSSATAKKRATRKKRRKTLPPKTKMKCISCGEEKVAETDFFKSLNPLHKSGYLPMCKDCMKKQSYNNITKDVDADKFQVLLRQIDYPFIRSLWDTSIAAYEKRYYGRDFPPEHRANIVSEYIRLFGTISNSQNYTWEDNEYLNRKYSDQAEETVSTSSSAKGVTFGLSRNKFEVTPDTVKLFGEGYTEDEYRAMQEKYDKLIVNYPAMTNFHVEALVNFVRYRVKAEQATVRGDVSDAKKWEDMAQTAADKAKINPSQLTQRDLQGGLNSFSELFKAIEEAEDIIPILPQFKYRPNDAPDFVIWTYVNYIRGLEGKPLCEYEDIYKFYDQRKQEYIDQYGDPYGIFTDDTSEKNRENIKKFIDIPNEDFGDDNG